MDSISTAIRAAARPARLPDGQAYLSISVREVVRLTEALGIEGRRVEIEALEQDIVPERYVRNMQSLSVTDQLKLLQATVSIVGLGGLGGSVCEILARLGIGRLKLFDGDRFEDNNLNRQLLSTQAVLGQSKAATAVNRIRTVNASIAVSGHNEFLNADNAAQRLASSDIIVDCLDNLDGRFVLAAASRETNTPLVSAALAGQSGHISVVFPDDRGLEDIYGQPGQLPSKGAETSLGCLPQAVTCLASLQCSEVMKLLLQPSMVLRNRLLIFDLADNTFEVMQLS
jgi:molybdopterin-synthase adenylyltransferase